MNSKKQSDRQLFRNRLEWLDTGAERFEDGGVDLFEAWDAPTLAESLGRGFRSIMAVIICIVIPALLYFDAVPTTAGGSEHTAPAGEIGSYRFVMIRPEPPPPAPVAKPGIGPGITGYTADLDELGLLDRLSGPAVQGLYEGDVTPAYLAQLNSQGLLTLLSYPAVVAYYNNQIPEQYLSELKAAGLLGALSFPAVITFYKRAVPLDYLGLLAKHGYLSGLSFPAVTALSEKSVPVEFLDELNRRELLEKLSFPSIITMYENRSL